MAAMICTLCGAQMNQHGEKLIYGEARNGSEIVEQLTEAHTCPNCGHNDARVAAL
jgi:DNA-directed RNA polymerase subunit RPC12/RpoP